MSSVAFKPALALSPLPTPTRKLALLATRNVPAPEMFITVGVAAVPVAGVPTMNAVATLGGVPAIVPVMLKVAPLAMLIAFGAVLLVCAHRDVADTVLLTFSVLTAVDCGAVPNVSAPSASEPPA